MAMSHMESLGIDTDAYNPANKYGHPDNDDGEKFTAIMELLMDADVVTDYCDKYGEPGYDNDGPVILGTYWCHCHEWEDSDKEHPLHGIEHKYPDEFEFLAAKKAELEWYDEWIVDTEHSKAYRTTADSYSWQPSYVLTDDCEMLTVDDDYECWIEWATNEPGRCIPNFIFDTEAMRGSGFVKEGDEHENGWYGEVQKPQDIFDAIVAEDDEAEVIFQMSSVEQFRVLFVAWVRRPKSTAVSSNHKSHDCQMQDGLDHLRHNHPEEYEEVVKSYPEVNNLHWDSYHTWLDEEKHDPELSSWITDSIEDKSDIMWRDGEPYCHHPECNGF